MADLFKKNVIYLTVAIIGILLAVDILFTYFNNSIIERNQQLREEVETTRQYYDAVGKSVIHSLDIGLRGFAIVRNPQFSAPMDNAKQWKDSILTNLEAPLRRLDYDFRAYTVFKDSLDSYVDYCFRLKTLLQEDKEQEFISLFATDKGAHLWWQYLQCELDIKQHIDRIDAKAKTEYDAALVRNQIVQIILFIICFPTLIYTAFHTIKTYKLSELVRKAEKDKNRMLVEQNDILEQKVAERMQELSARNHEINSQSEELAAQRDTLLLQNKKLQDASELIEKQHEEIQVMNRQLKTEVEERTQDLQITNKELIAHNNQLEQFAFITAHNLRAPLARILGLTNLLRMSKGEKDQLMALGKLEESTKDLDHVIQDLNVILSIRKHTGNLVEVDLETIFERVKRSMEKEIKETQTSINADFHEVRTVYAVLPYIESIFYNLISNAIKYRDPDRPPVISVKTKQQNEFVCLMVKDNGLGIDLTKYRSEIFSLYKRFHLHMEGKGLGLYLVKTQVEALGGKIDLQSELNSGTTFFVYFKRHQI